MQTFYAFAVFLAVVDYKQFQSFFSAKSVAYEEKKNQKKKKLVRKIDDGAPHSQSSLYRADNNFSLSFFPCFILFFCSFFFLARAADCRKGGTARNVSQPRLLWSGHATHPMRRWGGGGGVGE